MRCEENRVPNPFLTHDQSTELCCHVKHTLVLCFEERVMEE